MPPRRTNASKQTTYARPGGKRGKAQPRGPRSGKPPAKPGESSFRGPRSGKPPAKPGESAFRGPRSGKPPAKPGESAFRGPRSGKPPAKPGESAFRGPRSGKPPAKPGESAFRGPRSGKPPAKPGESASRGPRSGKPPAKPGESSFRGPRSGKPPAKPGESSFRGPRSGKPPAKPGESAFRGPRSGKPSAKPGQSSFRGPRSGKPPAKPGESAFRGPQPEQAPVKKRVVVRRSTKTGLQIHWPGLKAAEKIEGAKRFYRLETLASAVERRMKTQDGVFEPAFRAVLGPGIISAVDFTFAHERNDRLVFRVTLVSETRRRVQLALVVAKNEKELSTALQAEYGFLHELHRRAPKEVIQPAGGGTVYLPDRYGRKSHGREVQVYLTPWLAGFGALGVGRDGQFTAMEERVHLCSKAETERIKNRLVELIARTYEPGARSALDLEALEPADFAIRRSEKGLPQLRIVGCRTMARHVSPPRLIGQIATARWKEGENEIRLAPESMLTWAEGLERGSDRESALAWLRAYRRALDQGDQPETGVLPKALLDEYLEAR